MAKGNFTSGPGSRRGRPRGSKQSPYVVPLVTRITQEASERLKSTQRATYRKVCALVSEALNEYQPMKSRTVTAKIKTALKDLGVDILPGTAAERGVKRAGVIGSEVINAGRKAAAISKKQWEAASDTVREKIHRATEPRSSR